MGLLTTAVVAAAVAGGTGHAVSQDNSATIITSDKSDVIVCCAVSFNMTQCNGSRSRQTPAQYAGDAGYKTLHKVSFLSRPKGCDMIIMEVSK